MENKTLKVVVFALVLLLCIALTFSAVGCSPERKIEPEQPVLENQPIEPELPDENENAIEPELPQDDEELIEPEQPVLENQPIEPEDPEQIVEGFWAYNKLDNSLGEVLDHEEAELVEGEIYQILDSDLKGIKYTFTSAGGTGTVVGGVGDLVHVEIPKDISIGGKTYQVTAIGNEAFMQNDKIERVVIPEGVTIIGESAFNGCELLCDFNLPEKLTTIGDNAFADCNSLSRIALPDEMQTLGDYAFANCKNFTSVVIPVSLINIGEYPFYQCFNFTDIYYKGTVKQWQVINGDWVYPLAFGNVITIHCNYVE